MFVCPFWKRLISNQWNVLWLVFNLSHSDQECRFNEWILHFFLFDSKYFFKGYSGFTQSWIIILQEFMPLIWNTLLKVRRLKIWVTVVVCNLLMNNLTTNKSKQLKSSVTEEQTVCAVSRPSMHCLHNVFTISLEKSLSWLSADCKCLFCSSTSHCPVLLFYNSMFGYFKKKKKSRVLSF